jgi:mono/diheme cytochrome c family protein
MRRAGGALLAAALALSACGAPSSGRSAESLWKEHCENCHGADGRGVAARRDLEPGIDLTASKMVAAHARGAVYQRIAYGYGTMPGFGHKLELGDLELLTDFVLRLHQER